jgi:hypothetical protein
MVRDYIPAGGDIFLITSALRLKHASLVWVVLYSVQIGAPLSQGALPMAGEHSLFFFPNSPIWRNSTICGWMDGTLCTASVASPETTRATLLVHYSTVCHDRAKQSLCWRFVNLLEMRSTLMDVENVERRN